MVLPQRGQRRSTAKERFRSSLQGRHPEKIAARRPKRYPTLVLVEGGHSGWSAARVRSFAQGGGKRVLLLCGQRGCALAAKHAAQRLERAGVKARVETAAGEGHSYGGALSELAARQLPWLLSDAG